MLCSPGWPCIFNFSVLPYCLRAGVIGKHHHTWLPQWIYLTLVFFLAYLIIYYFFYFWDYNVITLFPSLILLHILHIPAFLPFKFMSSFSYIYTRNTIYLMLFKCLIVLVNFSMFVFWRVCSKFMNTKKNCWFEMYILLLS